MRIQMDEQQRRGHEDRLNALILKCRDGTATAAEFEELERTLLECGEARVAYWEYAILDAELRNLLAS